MVTDDVMGMLGTMARERSERSARLEVVPKCGLVILGPDSPLAEISFVPSIRPHIRAPSTTSVKQHVLLRQLNYTARAFTLPPDKWAHGVSLHDTTLDPFPNRSWLMSVLTLQQANQVHRRHTRSKFNELYQPFCHKAAQDLADTMFVCAARLQVEWTLATRLGRNTRALLRGIGWITAQAWNHNKEGSRKYKGFTITTHYQDPYTE
ncbi:hypothetical protein B0O80DRAFT_430701 [Mortierella sp. GBAus27b]|nr:hypothetical protein B0O80DRAFT_430701 [Mortierella sp. GBAus27b]